ncbi:MAG: helicase-associated domain-containing protein [Isosphaeraceae bacterium]
MSISTTSGPAPSPLPVSLADAYRAALRRYEGGTLVEILMRFGPLPLEQVPKPPALPDAVKDRLSDSRTLGEQLASLDPGARLALGLLTIVDAAPWPVIGLALTLRLVGVEPIGTIRTLLERGLLAIQRGEPGALVGDLARLLDGEIAADLTLIPHPDALSASRTVVPEGPGPNQCGQIRQVREADGLEPILRLAALWQRVSETPLRQTQQGMLYKRDRDRLEDEPVLAGPIADALEPLPDMVPLWLALARGVGLVIDLPGTDRIEAAPAEFWSDNAFHLPQMIAARWLGLRDWHETGGARDDGASALLALPFVRPAVLLWLATLDGEQWIALDDLAAHLDAQAPGWDRLALAGVEEPSRSRSGSGSKGRSNDPAPTSSALEAILLGSAYVLGLVRAAEEEPSGRQVVQLTPLGRYALALGPPPPPRPSFEHVLYVQPNFEMIAYRQGLTPPWIGQFSRFAHWEQLGAALELKLTADSVYRGLEGGLTPEAMLKRMQRHSARPLPAGVAEALRTWSHRRERITYHASATLIEFATAEDLETALTAWPEDAKTRPAQVADRLLLVEDESAIPFQRFRLTASRDYRRLPESCVTVDPDGVTLALDVSRSDLFVEAELTRFADELGFVDSHQAASLPRRRFQVTPASLSKAIGDGVSPAFLTRWFLERTGSEIPPAVRLLLHAVGPSAESLQATRPLVLHVPSADVLDGLAQHPATRDSLGQRLGPTTVIVPDDAIDRLRRGLESLGLSLSDGSNSPPRRPS